MLDTSGADQEGEDGNKANRMMETQEGNMYYCYSACSYLLISQSAQTG